MLFRTVSPELARKPGLLKKFMERRWLPMFFQVYRDPDYACMAFLTTECQPFYHIITKSEIVPVPFLCFSLPSDIRQNPIQITQTIGGALVHTQDGDSSG